MNLEYRLERTLVIRAERATVFRYFTDSERFARWWGEGSRIDPRPGGKLRIRYPNGVTASGEVLEIEPDRRIVFTYGYDDPGKPIPPGGSRITITLDDVPEGTRLVLWHDVADEATREAHAPGWRYQLALFANVVAAEQHARAGETIDTYFAVWNEAEDARRHEALKKLATEDVSFRDAIGWTAGREDLEGHITAARRHMPGLTLSREGDVRQCQGTVLADWVARTAAGEVRARGTNVFELSPDGRIARITGFWASGTG